jgi:hypothetical protein
MGDSRRRLLGKPLNPLKFKRLDEADISGSISLAVEEGCVDVLGSSSVGTDPDEGDAPYYRIGDGTDADCWRKLNAFHNSNFTTVETRAVDGILFSASTVQLPSTGTPNVQVVAWEFANSNVPSSTPDDIGPPCNPQMCGSFLVKCEYDFNGTDDPVSVEAFVDLSVYRINPDTGSAGFAGSASVNITAAAQAGTLRVEITPDDWVEGWLLGVYISAEVAMMVEVDGETPPATDTIEITNLRVVPL